MLSTSIVTTVCISSSRDVIWELLNPKSYCLVLHDISPNNISNNNFSNHLPRSVTSLGVVTTLAPGLRSEPGNAGHVRSPGELDHSQRVHVPDWYL